MQSTPRITLMPNKPTTAEIIDKGDYLSLAFNPASLTIADLTAILKHHDIRIRLQKPYKKAQLVDLFTREIRALKQENLDAIGTTAQRVSQAFGPGTEDSGWVDDNVFQSGAQETRVFSRRSFPLHSLSESLQAPPVLNANTGVSSQKFSSNLPRISSFPNATSSAIPHSKLRHNSSQWSSVLPARTSVVRKDPQAFQATYSATIPSTISNVSSHPDEIPRKQRCLAVVRRTVFIVFILVLAGSLFQYKTESAPIGYCDRESHSNGNLVELQNERQRIKACREQQALCRETTCPSYSSAGFFNPDTCAPCPQHATCYLEDVICDDGYLLNQHLLSYIPFLSKIYDGLPGLGPVAFPSSCVKDPMRKRSVSALEEGISLMLAIERGRRICANEIESSFEGRDAQKWGVEVERLKEDVRKKISATDNFDLLFGEAIKNLIDYDRVIKDEDSEGRLFLASEHANMSLNCQITVAFLNTWKKWRNSILSIFVLTISGVYVRVQIATKRNADRHVSELVQLALNALRNQELSHHTDPIMTSAPYLSSLQLRDSMLQDEYSITTRARLWARVEKIVEGNANVRANMEELPGGDELRVWRWIGTRARQIPL